MSANTWQLQDAKNKFSDLVNKAQIDGPQIVTRHGKKAVVVLAFDDYKKLSKPKTNLYKFFRKSPLAKLEFEIERSKDLPRKVEL